MWLFRSEEKLNVTSAELNTVRVPSSSWTEYKTKLTPITRQEVYYDHKGVMRIRYIQTSRLDTETKNHYSPARDFHNVKVTVTNGNPDERYFNTYSKDRAVELVDKFRQTPTITIRRYPPYLSVYCDIPEVGYKSTEFADPYIMLAGLGIMAGILGMLSVFCPK